MVPLIPMLKDKYTRESERLKEENKEKKIISDDVYALCESIDALRRAIKGWR